MSYHWLYSSGETSAVFPSQADAETWRDLLAGGVEDVTLYEEQRAVYGPMSLRPPG